MQEIMYIKCKIDELMVAPLLIQAHWAMANSLCNIFIGFNAMATKLWHKRQLSFSSNGKCPMLLVVFFSMKLALN